MSLVKVLGGDAEPGELRERGWRAEVAALHTGVLVVADEMLFYTADFYREGLYGRSVDGQAVWSRTNLLYELIDFVVIAVREAV